MRNEPNFSKSQMFITLIKTTNYNKKWTLDTWSKRTQTNPILSASGGFIRLLSAFYPPFTRLWRDGGMAGLPDIVEKSTYKLDVHPFYPYAFS